MRKTSVLSVGLLVCLPSLTWAQSSDPAAEQSRLRLSGYIQFDYVSSPRERAAEQEDTFRFRRARLVLGGALADRIDWAASVETTRTPVLRDAYVRFAHLPAATVQVGQFMMPFGLEQYVFSSNTLEFTERILTPLVPSRDAGVMLTNIKPLFNWLTYAAAVANGTGQNTPDDNGAKDGILRLTATPPMAPGLQVAVSAARGEQPGGIRTRRGADIALERRHYHVAAEIVSEQADGLPAVGGGYLFGAWRFYPPSPTPGFHHFELGARYGRLTPQRTRQWELAGNYYVRPNVRFMCGFIVRTDPPPGTPAHTLQARANIRF